MKSNTALKPEFLPLLIETGFLRASLLAGSLLFLSTASAQAPATTMLCDTCGTVQSVSQVTREGKGGAAGVVGGAVVGGLIGNQFGGGSGKTLATVAGAAGGAYVGNEVQKKASTKQVWVTTLKMKDGSTRRFEQEASPNWAKGAILQVDGNRVFKP